MQLKMAGDILESSSALSWNEQNWLIKTLIKASKY